MGLETGNWKNLALGRDEMLTFANILDLVKLNI
jgi:hypothetical protein